MQQLNLISRTFIVCFLLLLTACNSSSSSSPCCSSSSSSSSSSGGSILPPSNPTLLPLSVTGTQINNSNGTSVHLHGVATTDLHAIYKGLYVPGMSGGTESSQNIIDHINMINDPLWNNANTIRLTVHPLVNDEVGQHGWTLVDPVFFINNIIQPAVNTVIESGRYAIIDWHYVGESWTGSNADRTVDFWNRMSALYANHPNVIFEIFNEPGSGTWNSWQQTAQGWVNAIRSGDWSQYGLANTPAANNLILVGGPYWSSTLPQSPSDNFFSGDNIVYVTHIYPFHTTSGIPNWANYTLQFHPVFFTEWGYENNSDANVTIGTASSYGTQFQSYINSHSNAHWIAWNWSPTYRSVMFDTNYVLLGNGQSTQASRFHGGNADTNENYMGQFVVDWLNSLGFGNVE